jgi:hypothetical protein
MIIYSKSIDEGRDDEYGGESDTKRKNKNDPNYVPMFAHSDDPVH